MSRNNFRAGKKIRANTNVTVHVSGVFVVGQSFRDTDATRVEELNIRTLDPALQHTIGQREELSFLDVKLANLAYCSGR